MRRSTSSSWAVVAALLVACSLILVASAASAADGDREKILAALAKQTGASVDDLRAVDAHHWVTGDLDAKRSFLKKICDEPREGLLPFIAFIAGSEREHQLRLAAIKAISLFGVLADRWDVRQYAFPVLIANTRDKSGQVVRFSLDELGRLNRWFRLDAELAPFYEKLFRGRDFNLKQLAFFALNDMKNREIVVSGVTSGLVGLAAGNYLGLGVAYAVRWS